ncbi:MAG: DUF1549 domain-containing protein, partial [Planctomycetales bacterium]|nr:DUF1549 domain-containing protein [Planctomycetales bacterium]
MPLHVRARLSLVSTLLLAGSLTTWADEPPNIPPADISFFENEIRPLFVAHCYECHSATNESSEGGLTLDSQSGWQTGGDSGPAVIPHHPEKSLLLQAISYNNVNLQMPPDGKLSDSEIRALTDWVKRGAPDPRVGHPREKAGQSSSIDIEKRRHEHWAWQPVRPGVQPEVRHQTWPQKPLDYYILAQLEQADLQPAPPADKAVILRRLYFDLTGLAPTPEDVRAFLGDNTENAYAQVVERLLDSPHFGEHWGQHWLDLMRYAETRGHEQDFPIPEAYRYRDYVIQAFNDDVPYDQLIIEHVAGDLIPSPRTHPVDHTNQSIQGTGFWHLHEATHSPVDIQGDETVRVQNQLDVFSRTFLGLSLGCARCHDHKFDAVSTRDYYAMFGFLQSSSFQLADVADPERQHKVADELTRLIQEYGPRVRDALIARLREQLKPEEDVTERLTHFAPSPDAFSESWRPSQQAINDQLTKLTVVKSVKDGELNVSRQTRPWECTDVVEDFTSTRHDHWITSGLRFGARPGRVGDLLLSMDTTGPAVYVLDESAAESDLASAHLSGFVRTRTFEVVGDRLWYRTRGSAEIFIAVDSHRVVAGPLHGVVRKTISGDPTRWQWHVHDVKDYIGHRVHVEFSPKSKFAVDCVVFAEQQPPAGLHGSAETRAQVAPTVADLQAALQRWATNAITSEDARLLNWLLANAAQLPTPPVDSVDSVDSVGPLVQSYAENRQQLEARIPSPVFALALLDGNGENEPVHIRGNHRNRESEPVPRSLIEALGETTIDSEIAGSGRMHLAAQLVDPNNPLVARVLVNRVWYHLMGRGIVESVDDFGVMGTPPS